MIRIQDYIASLAARYPDRAKVVSLGTTYENRSISALQLSLPPPPPPPFFSLSASFTKLIHRISTVADPILSEKSFTPKTFEGDEKKLGMLLSAESHAREWISAASAIYFAEELLQQAALFPDPTPPPSPPQDPDPVPDPNPEPPAAPRQYHRISSRSATELQQWISASLLRAWTGLVGSRAEGSDSAFDTHPHPSSEYNKPKGNKRKHGHHGGDEHDHSRAPALTPEEAYQLLKRYRVTIVPLSNPDGYAYTWLKKGGRRLWRKNRQPTGTGSDTGSGKRSECIGIDVNRNWDYQFPDSRAKPGWQRERERCSESFAGDEAFEALETAAVAKFLSNEEENVKVFLDLHSYGQNGM